MAKRLKTHNKALETSTQRKKKERRGFKFGLSTEFAAKKVFVPKKTKQTARSSSKEQGHSKSHAESRESYPISRENA